MDRAPGLYIGLVGAGPLARAIGARLAATGMCVKCWNRTSSRLAPLADAGASVAATLAELAAHARTLLVCVSDADAVRAIFLSPSQAPCPAAGCTIVNLGTIGDAESLALEQAFERAGAAYTDMPVSGGVEGALAGRLTAYIGAAPASDPAFDAMLVRLVHSRVCLNNNRKAQAMKVLNNLCEAVNLWGAAEAVTLGERYGFTLAELDSGLRSGRGNSDYLGVLLGRLAASGDAVAVSLATRFKDIALARDLAARLAAAAPLLDTVGGLYGATIAAYGAERDQVACHALLKSATIAR
jgi:3-hydroxyisobutyrate dehydrogenase-like beta-hydroxyacid dehydrogenase